MREKSRTIIFTKGGFIMAKLEKGTPEKGNLLPSKRATKYENAILKGNKRLYPELRLKAKAANERMRQLEKAGIKSPAYLSAQAQLETLGKRSTGNSGRRFSETGRATYNESELLGKILDRFLAQKTSGLRGAKQYYENVWQGANKSNQLSDAGITKEQWFEFWEEYPNSMKDRMYYDKSVKMFKAYMRKNKDVKPENKLTPTQIAQAIKEAETLKSAYKDKLGLTLSEVNRETQVSTRKK